MLFRSVDSSESLLERLTNSVHSLLIHRDFHSWFPLPNVQRKEPKKKDDIHSFFFFNNISFLDILIKMN